MWARLIPSGFLLIVLGLSACQSPVVPQQKTNYGYFCSESVLDQLSFTFRQAQINESWIGDYLFLEIPARDLFYPHSAKLVPRQHFILDAVAQLLACYQKVSVQVVGYTEVFGEAEENNALAKQRASRVVNYLWRYGIDARLITAWAGEQSLEIHGLRTARDRDYIRITMQKVP